jgi:hypothetical protein
MAQAWTDSEEKLLKEDPLKDVKDEIQHNSPRLRHVDLPSEDVQMGEDDVVKSHVPEAFADELQKDHEMVAGINTPGGSEAEFMEDDPLHSVKQELEHHSPHLKHVESPYSPRAASQDAGDVIKSEVPPAFEEELKNDHNIVKIGQEGNGSSTKVESHRTVTKDLQDPGFVRGLPRFRMSANPGNLHTGNADPETANMCVKDPSDEVENSETSNGASPQEGSNATDGSESNITKILPRGLPARGTPHFRISAHQGMRPGGPLSRDLKAESNTEQSSAGGDGTGLHRGGPPSVPNRGGLSNQGPKRGGLARTGSGVPGEQKAGGGSSLARQGSGAFGGGLARQGSGIPSAKGGNDLGDFASFLNSADFSKEESLRQAPADSDDCGEHKSVFGKIGEKLNHLNQYAPPYGPLHDADTTKTAE